jgi:L-ascorbate metabolism protein UlaG (beta-lactamase superfamily)
MSLLTRLRKERALASAQFCDGSFRNTSGAKPDLQGPTLPIMGEFFFGGKQRVPKVALPVHSPLEAWSRPAPDAELRMTWLGHSTVLIESGGVRVLTDPVFGERASPLSFAGPKRFHAVPATIDQLPSLNAVLLSHDHFDHLCVQSVRALARMGTPFVTSLGVGARLEALGVAAEKIVELDWWEEVTLPGGRLGFAATPAQHFSGRGVLDRNQTLWSSWVITTDHHKVFFSGDTGLTAEFAAIRDRFAPFDATLLEIGAWHPAWGSIHLGPDNALTAFEMLGGGTLVPVHWGTFDLALHTWDEPAETLVSLAQARGTRVVTPELGKPLVPAGLAGPTPWWRGLVER